MNNKDNLELFKQALNEAVSAKIDKMIAECPEELVPKKTEEEKQQFLQKLYKIIDDKKDKAN